VTQANRISRWARRALAVIRSGLAVPRDDLDPKGTQLFVTTQTLRQPMTTADWRAIEHGSDEGR
jgi:hypothetical protein